jgi:HlyD family secretion protein
VIGLAIFVLLYLYFNLLQSKSSKTISVAASSVVIGIVEKTTFNDVIPLTAQVHPVNTFYIDTIEGGKVTQVFVEDGAMVNEDDPIVSLVNSSLLLNVIESESEVSQLLNNISTLELSKSKDDLASQREAIEIGYNIDKHEINHRRLIALKQKNHISDSELEDIAVELKYWRDLEVYNSHYREINNKMQTSQLKQLKAIYDVQQQNLTITRQNLDELNISAPAQGQITAFNIKKGQAIARGERIAQVDDNTNFKLVGFLDEFYLSRVVVGQQTLITIGDEEITHKVIKIFPAVNNGRFKIELLTDAEGYISKVKRGQSVQGTIQLASNANALVIPNGAFFQQTLGNWIFVLDPNSNVATRRKITIGSSNPYTVEIINGVREGELVITSDYSYFKDFEKVAVTQ